MTVPDPAAMGCDPRSPDGERQRKRLTAALRAVDLAVPWSPIRVVVDGAAVNLTHACALVTAYLRDPPVHVPARLRESWQELRALPLGDGLVAVYRDALVWCLSAICYTHLGPGKRDAAALHVREVLRCAIDARIARGAWAWTATLRVWFGYRRALWRLRRW